MSSLVQIEGSPQPLGTVRLSEEEGYNFALYSRHATSVTLLLYAARDLVNPALRVPLDYLIHKSGRIWHCRLAARDIPDARYYAYAVDGPNDPHGEHHFFDSKKVTSGSLCYIDLFSTRLPSERLNWLWIELW